MPQPKRPPLLREVEERLAGEANSTADENLVARYRQLLEGARSDDELRLILGALGGAAHPDALKLALPLLDKPGVRTEAEVAVKKIVEAVKGKHPEAAKAALERLSQKSQLGDEAIVGRCHFGFGCKRHQAIFSVLFGAEEF